MDKFKSTLRKRIALMSGFNLLAVAFILLTRFFSPLTVYINEDAAEYIQGFQLGIILGMQLLILVPITKYRRALKEEDLCKKLYIEENDERRKLIRDKIGGAGFNFTIGAVATATVIAGFFHLTVFITLLCVLFFIAMVKGCLKLYYRRKF